MVYVYNFSKINTMNEVKKNYNNGHRERLRQRFKRAGQQALDDYEVLELLLFFAIPRGDVKKIAKDLLSRFGSLCALVEADENLMQEIKGVGPSISHLLKVQQAVVQRQLRNAIIKKPVFKKMKEILEYCQMTMSHNIREQLRLFFLDSKKRLIFEEVQQTGTVDRTSIYPREIIKRALDLGASGVILVHNHPSGDPWPSNIDIQITLQVIEAGRTMDVEVHDHLIIGKNSFSSLKQMGVLSGGHTLHSNDENVDY